MKDSLIILAFFVLGIILGRLDLIPDILRNNDPTLPALWILMSFVGISLGMNKKLRSILTGLHPSVLLIPVATTIGTFAGTALASIFLIWTLFDCLAVGSGFAYYSLSSVFITQYKGPELGTIALLANIIRELITLLFTPWLFLLWGPLAPITSGGASTVDTTLPVIAKYCGKAWIMPSIIHAMFLDLSVPLWVTLFCSL